MNEKNPNNTEQTVDQASANVSVPNPQKTSETLNLPQADASLTRTSSKEIPPVPKGKVPPKDLPQIAGYRITGEIARGGMGRVLEGQEIALEREVAIKVLLPGATDERFVLESKITAQLPHPNIPPVYALGELPDSSPYLVMKRIRGKTLADELKNRKDLAEGLSGWLGVFEQICQAVGFAHSRNIIHRDLKPANIMVGAFGEVQVMDWGLAKNIDTPESSEKVIQTKSNEADLTQAGSIMGTPAYMAPEQARGESVDARADVFALGGILAYILVGQTTFQGKTVQEVVAKAALADTSEILATLRQSSHDRELIAIVERCLKKKPDNRPSNGQEVAELVNAYRKGVENRLREAENEKAALEAKQAEQRKRRRVMQIGAGLIGGVLLIGMAVSGYFAYESNQNANTAKKNADESKKNEEIAEANAKQAKTNEDQAKNNEGLAKQNEALAKENEAKAIEQKNRADEQTRLALERQDYSERLVYAGRLALAQNSIRDGKSFQAQRYLDECQWNLHGWEYHFLQSQATSEQTIRFETASSQTVSWSADGKKFLTSGLNAKIWDAENCKEIASFDGHKQRGCKAYWSPDGKKIATIGEDNTAKIWDAEKTTLLHTVQSGRQSFYLLSWSPDSQKVFVASPEKNLAKIYEVEKMTEVAEFKNLKGYVNTASWSPDGKKIVINTATGANSIKVMDAEKGTEVLTIEGNPRGTGHVSWSPDGTRIASAGYSRVAVVWDAQTGQQVLEIQGHEMEVRGVNWSPDGSRVVTTSLDKNAIVWDAKRGTRLQVLSGHGIGIFDAVWNPDGTRIATASGDMTVKIWNVGSGKGVSSLSTVGAINRPVWSPDGSRFFVMMKFGSGSIWDAKMQKELVTFDIKTPPSEIRWSPNGKWILFITQQEAKVWDAEKGTEVFSLKEQIGGVISADWSSDSRQIVTASGQQLRIWDVETRTSTPFNKIELKPIQIVRFSPDSQTIASTHVDGHITLWDVKTLKQGPSYRIHSLSISSLSWNADGKKILTSSTDKTAKVWEPTTGKDYYSLNGHTDMIHSAEWSPDFRRIVTASSDKTIRIWETEKGIELLSLTGHEGVVYRASWSPDGEKLLSGSQDQTTKLWSFPSADNSLAIAGNLVYLDEVRWHSSGKFFLTVGGDGIVKIWDATKGTILREFKGHTSRTRSVMWSPDETRIASASDDGTAKIWESKTGKVLHTLKGHNGALTCVRWSSDGKRLLTSGIDKTARIWDAESGVEIKLFRGHALQIESADWGPQDREIVTASWDMTAKIWDVETTKEKRSFKVGETPVHFVKWSADGKQILTTDGECHLKLWAPDNDIPILTIKVPKGKVSSIRSAVWSPNGKRILTGGFGGPLVLWDAQTGVMLHSYPSLGQINSVSFSPDDRQIIATYSDGTAKVHSTEVGVHLRTLTGHTKPISSVAFSDDGKTIYAWDVLGKVLAWSFPAGKPAEVGNRPQPQERKLSVLTANGLYAAKADALAVRLIDLSQPNTESGDKFPLPTLEERTRYHEGQANLAATAKNYFAQAFHLGRMLLDDPTNAILKKKHEEALNNHANPPKK